MNKFTAIASLTSLSILGLALPGCGAGSHGKYTEEQRNAAKMKLDGLKAGLEYQTAMGDFMAGDFEKALRAVQNSLAMNDQNAKAWTLRGRIMLETGNLEAALQSFAKSEEIDPEFVDTQYYQGVVAERLDRKEDALRRYTRAAQLDPGGAQYAIAAAEIMMDLGRMGEAKTFLESRGPTLCDNAGIRQVLGHIAMIDRDYTKAETLFNEARLLAPNDMTMLEDLVESQIALAKFADAEVNLRKLLKEPTLASRRDLLHMRARCLIETDRSVDAREILIKLCNDSNGSADIEAWNDLGQVSYKLNDFNRVRAASAKLIAIAPRRPEGYILRAIWERKRGDVTAARVSAQAAVDRGPSADAFLLLASIQAEQHDTAGAIRTLELAVKSDAANSTAREMLSLLNSQRVATQDPDKN